MNSTEKLISTHNIFIDTSRAAEGNHTEGDNFILNLNTQTLDASQGEFLRLTLNDFCCYKNFTSVNKNNSVFIVDIGAAQGKLALTHQNYDTIFDLATEFASVLSAYLLTQATTPLGSVVISDLKPDSSTGINGTTDNIISYTINFKDGGGAPTPHGITGLLVQFFEEEGDTFALLGGNRVIGSTPSVLNSITIDTSDANSINIQCLYPAQRSTTSHIYLRTSLATQATETASLNSETDIVSANEAMYSNILGKIPVNTEFCVFNSNTGKEYYIDLKQKHISNVKLYLTDEHNRRIGRRPAQVAQKTATGTGIAQSTLGNLNFNCVIRADVIRDRLPAERFSKPAPIDVSARQTGVLTVPDKPPF